MKHSDKLRLVFAALSGDTNARSLLRWKLLRPDRLLYDHPLREGLLVYDVGGYRGDWTAGMLARYSCEYHVFEPHPEAFRGLTKRFADLPSVKLHHFALGRGSGLVSLSSAAEGSSIISHRDAGSIEVRLVDACGHLRSEGRPVALMKLNIEGAEFDLLEELLWSDVRDSAGDFLVQFHKGPRDAKSRYERIARKLLETHRCIWRYPFLWELWRRNDS